MPEEGDNCACCYSEPRLRVAALECRQGLSFQEVIRSLAELRIAAEGTDNSRDRLLIYHGHISALHKCELIYHPVLLVM